MRNVLACYKSTIELSLTIFDVHYACALTKIIYQIINSVACSYCKDPFNYKGIQQITLVTFFYPVSSRALSKAECVHF